MHVSSEYFRVLGARVLYGRTFSNVEDRPRGPHVAIFSYGFWSRRFGSDATLVGRTIGLSGESYKVIGVLEREFVADPLVDVYLPLQTDPFRVLAAERSRRRADHDWRGRRPGVCGPAGGRSSAS